MEVWRQSEEGGSHQQGHSPAAAQEGYFKTSFKTLRFTELNQCPKLDNQARQPGQRVTRRVDACFS